jgi:CheY-like chemotaxis protein
MYKEAPEKYSLILMDIQMPEMDGYEATRAIRALEAKRFESLEFAQQTPKQLYVPIIAMTANVFREDIDKARESGMNDHLGKPIDFDVLLQKFKEYLPRRE